MPQGIELENKYYCAIILTLPDTIDCVQFESGGQKPKGHIISRKLKKHPLLSKPTEFRLQRMFHESGEFAFLMDGFEPLA